jgi:hypothetical protein
VKVGRVLDRVISRSKYKGGIVLLPFLSTGGRNVAEMVSR